MNSLRVIMPYRWNGGWVFDDPAVELHREPFVAGADTVCEILSQGQPKFRLIFSDATFPDAALHLSLLRAEHGGHSYDSPIGTVWLCPALLKYFPSAPTHIWAKAEYFPTPRKR